LKKSNLLILLAIIFLSLPVLTMVLWHRQIYSEDCTGADSFRIEKYGKIEAPQIEESSGLSFLDHDKFYTHNDDTDSSLYLISAKGKMLKKWTLPYKNRDWEELCSDENGVIFIGDFGNNFNNSKALKIYIFDPKSNKVMGIIRFRYEEQTEYPPYNPGKMNFDCEAMVYQKDSLYLFTKNKNERGTYLYALPAKSGNFVVRRKQTINLLGMVTAASLRPDGKELALMTYGKIYFFSLTNGMNKISDSENCLAWWQFRQSESISYWGYDRLLAGNEQRELFLITRK